MEKRLIKAFVLINLSICLGEASKQLAHEDTSKEDIQKAKKHIHDASKIADGLIKELQDDGDSYPIQQTEKNRKLKKKCEDLADQLKKSQNECEEALKLKEQTVQLNQSLITRIKKVQNDLASALEKIAELKDEANNSKPSVDLRVQQLEDSVNKINAKFNEMESQNTKYKSIFNKLEIDPENDQIITKLEDQKISYFELLRKRQNDEIAFMNSSTKEEFNNVKIKFKENDSKFKEMEEKINDLTHIKIKLEKENKKLIKNRDGSLGFAKLILGDVAFAVENIIKKSTLGKVKYLSEIDNQTFSFIFNQSQGTVEDIEEKRQSMSTIIQFLKEIRKEVVHPALESQISYTKEDLETFFAKLENAPVNPEGFSAFLDMIALPLERKDIKNLFLEGPLI